MKRSALLLIGLCSFASFAQYGYSSGTMGMLRSDEYYTAYVDGKDLTEEQKKNYRDQALAGLLPQRIVPEEIINYHHHLIAIPSGKNKVSLVPELTEHPLNQGHYLMQVGIATATELPADRKPVGVMYVLDISGSMGDGKLEKAKDAMIASLAKMSSDDYFGVVLFDDQAQVLIPYEKFGSRKADIIAKVKAVTTNGGTDILKGLDLGIDQLTKGSLPEHPKSILLLTDGNTNVGETNKDEVIRKYMERSGNSIRVTTMGIGIDLHQDMLRDLSSRTHGQFHYIEDYADVQKTCVNEFASLTSPIGKEVMLSVNIPAGFELKKVYGASSWVLKEGLLQINIEDLNYQLTQVVMLDLEQDNNLKMNTKDLNATLTYTDYMNGTPISLKSTTTVLTAENKELYEDMMKNFLIADWAVELKNISDAYHAKPDTDALKQQVGALLSYPVMNLGSIEKDEDVERLKTIFEKVSKLVA